MKSVLRSTILISFLFLFVNSCSKDAPIPDAVVPTPTVTFTLAVAASEGGSVNNPGDTHNENTNVSLTASPAVGYTFSGWTGDASGSTNPLSVSMTQNKNITANFIRTNPPVISLVGSSTINLTVGETFTDPGAIAEDSIDGDLTSSITSSGTVDTSTTGTYTIEYSVSNAAGNITSVTRVVVVNLDLPPTITLTGSSNITLLVGDAYIEDGFIASDEVDGDLTSSIITTGTVDTSTVGTYTLVYSVSDTGNNTSSVTRTIAVKTPPDNTATPEPEYNYEYNQINLNEPPFGGTIFITGDIITSSDPSLFSEIEYKGTDSRQMYDRRNGGAWINIEPYLFDTSFTDGLRTEIQVNPEFTLEEANVEANKYAFLIGQLSTALRKDVETMWIHKGIEAYGGGNYNILVHTGMTEYYENFDTGIVEETLIHEAAHTSLDAYHYPDRETNGENWIEAVENDSGCYISTYARDNQYREDIAELMPLYVAVRYFSERISSELRDKVLSCNINRIRYLDSQNLDMSLYED